jgi:hypothetical protein
MIAIHARRRRLIYINYLIAITLVGYEQQIATPFATADHRRRLPLELIIQQQSRSSVIYSRYCQQ